VYAPDADVKQAVTSWYLGEILKASAGKVFATDADVKQAVNSWYLEENFKSTYLGKCLQQTST
jgi:hypothetical protein